MKLILPLFFFTKSNIVVDCFRINEL